MEVAVEWMLWLYAKGFCITIKPPVAFEYRRRYLSQGAPVTRIPVCVHCVCGSGVPGHTRCGLKDSLSTVWRTRTIMWCVSRAYRLPSPAECSRLWTCIKHAILEVAATWLSCGLKSCIRNRRHPGDPVRIAYCAVSRQDASGCDTRACMSYSWLVCGGE